MNISDTEKGVPDVADSVEPSIGIGFDRSSLIGQNANLESGRVLQTLSVQGDSKDISQDKEGGTNGSETPGSIRKSPVSITRSKRRGLFGSLTVIPEVEEPIYYSRKTKWFLTFVVGFAAATTSLGAAVILPALAETAHDLHASPTVTNLSVALYMLSISFFPLWWASFSETSGRRTVYISSFILYVVFAILCAVAKSIGVFVSMRMLCGGAGAAVQAVGAGTLADMWEPFERGKAMSLFYLGPLTGPLTAPIIGGFLTQRWGWRSTQWFLVIWGGVAFVLLLFALPETLKDTKAIVSVAEEGVESLPLGRVSSNTSVTRVRMKKLPFIFRRLFVDPLKIVLNLRYPPILFTSYFAALAFGSLYVINISLQDVFAKPPYNFSVSKIGLVYIPSGFGFLISALFAGKWADVIMAREARRKSRYDANGELVVIPEDRMMENAWLAAIGFPASLVVYGWTADKGVFWVVPMLANLVFGLSTMLIFSLAVTMLTEFLPRKPSTGVAVANFLRNILSCVGSVIGDPLIRAVGNGWLFTGLAVIVSTGVGVVWAMRKFGPRWRKSMDRKGIGM